MLIGNFGQIPSGNTEAVLYAVDTSSEKESPKDKAIGIVAYTDGSCKPTNPGFTGWGTHGYLYRIADKDEQVTVEKHLVTNNGYLKPEHLHYKFNGKEAVPVVPLQYFDFMGSSLTIGTNNQAEVMSIIRVMKFAIKSDVKYLTIRADSEYARQGLLKWCFGWERNNWITSEGAPVKNREHWEEAHQLHKQLKDKGCIVEVHWVKGHNGHMGNEQADILAGIASNYSMQKVFREAEDVYPAKNYWKTDVERHPMLSFKRIYFNSSAQYNQPGVYYHADTGAADHLIGKRIPETGLAVIRLNEPVEIIENVKKRQYEVARELNSIIMMKLDRIYDKGIYPYLETHGPQALIPAKGNLNLNWFDKKPVNIEVGATGLSMRAVDCFNLLEELLDSFLQETKGENKSNPVNVHDITPEFYDFTEAKVKNETVLKCTLKPNFTVGFQDMTIHVEEPFNGSSKKLKIPLILGTDLLPRNNLKKLEAFNPKVYLLTWKESEKALRYATVIRCDKGVGIWSNFFADRIFLI